MDPKTLELIESLRTNNPSLNGLMNSHQVLNRQVDDLNNRHHLSGDEILELSRLKREKLSVRDQIEDIVHQKASA